MKTLFTAMSSSKGHCLILVAKEGNFEWIDLVEIAIKWEEQGWCTAREREVFLQKVWHLVYIGPETIIRIAE